MTERTYPYTAWTLMPSYKPVQVEIVEEGDYWNRDGWDRGASGKLYALNELFPSQAQAIADGRRRLDGQQAKLDKMQAAINKRRAALDKAEASK